MVEPIIILFVFLYFYLLKAPLYLNFFDPLQLLALTEVVMVLTIYYLPNLTFDNKLYFLSVVFIYSQLWLFFSIFFRRKYFCAIHRFTTYLESVSWRSLQVLQAFLLIVGLLVLVVGKVNGFTGDSRLALTKILRPIEAFWTIGFYIYIVGIGICEQRKNNYPFFVAAIILICFIITFGKGFVLNLLLPISLIFWHRKKKIKFQHIVVMFVILVLGLGAGLLFAHGASLYSIYGLVYARLINDSDIFILGMSDEMISGLKLTNFYLYVFGPFFKVLGLGNAVDFNIGAQIGSIIAGKTVFTGPNAQLSYLGFVYFNSYVTAFLACLSVLAAWFLIKMMIIKYVAGRARMSISVSFVLLFSVVYPQSALKDPTFTASFFIVTFTSILMYIVVKSVSRSFTSSNNVKA